jgi:DNA-binding NarL/FixJ family response regulator
MDGTTGTGARRSRRDWIVDATIFALAVLFGLFTAIQRAGSPVQPEWLFELDQVVGALGCAALWLRRRMPLLLSVVLVAASAFSELVAGAMLAALFTVAVHRSRRVSVAVFAFSLVAALVYTVVRPEPAIPQIVMITIGLATQSAAYGWGVAIHHQRQLVARARSEARLRTEQAQMEAREAVAREMHDVLGHRLSLLSVHAGALEYRPDAPAEDVARAARVIRESAHQALQDLREGDRGAAGPGGRAPPADRRRHPRTGGRVPACRDGRGTAQRRRGSAAGHHRTHGVPGGAGGPDQRPQARARRTRDRRRRRIRRVGAHGRGRERRAGSGATGRDAGAGAHRPRRARRPGRGQAGTRPDGCGRLAGAGLATVAGVIPDDPVDVLIVDDDPLVRAGLTMMLGGTPDIRVVAEAGDGTEVLPLVDRHAPAVVLMDIRMPGMDGLAATEALRARGRAPEVIVLTTFDADRHVLRALRAGAAGFLLKDTPPEEIVAAVRLVARGRPVLSPDVTRRLIARVAESDHDRRRDRARARLALLNDRERDVAVAVGQGRSNAEIGALLHLAVPTVKTHVSNILTKLDLNNRVQIALLAHDAGLLD